MKKTGIIALLTALFMLLALGRAEEPVSMRVCGCDEWVSLRAEPDTRSERLLKVPLGETVYNCVPANERFTYCEYEDRAGYILTGYLEPLPQIPRAEAYLSPVTGLSLWDIREDGGVTLLEEGGETVLYSRHYAENGELLLIGRFDASGAEIWAYSTFTSMTTELDATEAFLAGTAWDRLAMVYNSWIGLTALDAETGEIRWTLEKERVSLGASITHAVDDFGVMYVCGYYGPDPVAIGADGSVLWTSDVEDTNVFWPYEIRVVEGGIIVCYDSLSQTPASGHYEAFIAFGGNVEWISIRE